jgi:pimeloyl-ACP methyl ester carboxylesterase
MGPRLTPGESDAKPDDDPYLLHSVTSGSGPAMVLIHGVAGSNMVWDRIAPLLDRHFRITRVDLLGYGRSPKPDVSYTPHRHVAAIRRTLAQNGIVAPYALVGLSMGANLMLEYARRWPDEVQAMVGLGFPYYPSEAAARVGLKSNLWTRMALEHPVLSRVVVPSLWSIGRRVPGLFSGAATIYTGAMAKDALHARYQSYRSSLLECMVYYRLDEPLRASGKQRRLFIHGSEDQWASADVVREAIKPFASSELFVVENAPHNLAVAAPEQTAALILDHTERRLRPNSPTIPCQRPPNSLVL